MCDVAMDELHKCKEVFSLLIALRMVNVLVKSTSVTRSTWHNYTLSIKHKHSREYKNTAFFLSQEMMCSSWPNKKSNPIFLDVFCDAWRVMLFPKSILIHAFYHQGFILTS